MSQNRALAWLILIVIFGAAIANKSHRERVDPAYQVTDAVDSQPAVNFSRDTQWEQEQVAYNRQQAQYDADQQVRRFEEECLERKRQAEHALQLKRDMERLDRQMAKSREESDRRLRDLESTALRNSPANSPFSSCATASSDARCDAP